MMGDMVQRAKHWIAHKLGRNTGQVVSWTEHGFAWVGYECDGCGEISGALPVHESIERDLMAHTRKRAEQHGGSEA